MNNFGCGEVLHPNHRLKSGACLALLVSVWLCIGGTVPGTVTMQTMSCPPTRQEAASWRCCCGWPLMESSFTLWFVRISSRSLAKFTAVWWSSSTKRYLTTCCWSQTWSGSILPTYHPGCRTLLTAGADVLVSGIEMWPTGDFHYRTLRQMHLWFRHHAFPAIN